MFGRFLCWLHLHRWLLTDADGRTRRVCARCGRCENIRLPDVKDGFSNNGRFF